MHSISKVNVRVTRRSVQDPGAWGQTGGGVTGGIVLTDVGLGLDDAAKGILSVFFATAKKTPQKLPGHSQRIASIKVGGQNPPWWSPETVL